MCPSSLKARPIELKPECPRKSQTQNLGRIIILKMYVTKDSEWVWVMIRSVQFSSVAQSRPILCNPVDWSTPAFPVHHQLPEFVQTHVHWVSDAIQPSHPVSSLSPLVLNLSQYKCLFQQVSSLHQVVKVLEFQLQHQSFQWIQDWFPLGWTGWIPLLSKGLKPSPTPQFKSINSSVLNFLHKPTLTSIHDYWKNHSLD